MKKTIFALSALSLILVGCNDEEMTTQAQPEPTQQQMPQMDATSEAQPGSLAETEDLQVIDPTESKANSESASQLTSQQWQGTYSGILPCADCEGIQTTLTLNQDETYQLEEVYLGKDDSSFNSTGAVQWDETGTIITLVNDNGSTPVKYALEGDSLAKLDADGEPINGDIAALYQLTKEN